MNYSQAYNLIVARATAQWTAAYPAIPIIFTNEQRPTFDEANFCLHVEIRPGVTRTVGFGGIGQNLQRQNGEVIARCFGPADTKMATMNAMADAFCAAFRYWSSVLSGTTLHFFDTGPAGGGEDEKDGNFYQLDAIASFYFDTIG